MFVRTFSAVSIWGESPPRPTAVEVRREGLPAVVFSEECLSLRQFLAYGVAVVSDSS
jgi:hypothetical protein